MSTWDAPSPTVRSAVVALMAAHVVLFVYFTPTLAMAQNMVGATCEPLYRRPAQRLAPLASDRQ